MSTSRLEHPGSLDECRDAIAILDKLEDVTFGTPATPDTIERAEAALGVSLPPSLKYFAADAGTVSIAGKEILGLTGEEFSTTLAVNIVGATLLERARGLPDRSVVIHNPGDGTRYVIDLDAGGIVRVWTPRSGERGDERHPHFGRFLLELASDAEGDEKETRFKERRREQLERLNRGDK